jgi:serine/threonine protein kinase
MLEAVQAVHEQKVVHSDLKPANFVLVKGRLKIIDFGIAKAIANDTVNIQRDVQVSCHDAVWHHLDLHYRFPDRHGQLYVSRSCSQDEGPGSLQGSFNSDW